ncbi:MAG: succinate dehydrogenase/fumarate reductase iron-sulfur subunit [Chloroflexota bacterium]
MARESKHRITVRVLRSPTEPEGKPVYQAYWVETFPRMSVLDALFTIQREHDRTLAFRCSCRLGMCGTCAVIVNGREGLACQTLVEQLGGAEITLRPLNYLPVVKDLAVDLEPFFDRYRSVKPYFVPREASDRPQVIKQGEGERKWVDPALGCITCGICFSACSVVGLNPDFPGPAALNRAYTLTSDVRDAARDERLEAASGPDGVWRCHQQFNCASACPRHLVPTQAIRQLRLDAAGRSANPLAAPLRWLRGKALNVVDGR